MKKFLRNCIFHIWPSWFQISHNIKSSLLHDEFVSRVHIEEDSRFKSREGSCISWPALTLFERLGLRRIKVFANTNSFELASFHHSVEEDFVEDKHVSVLRSDLLDPLDLQLISCCVSRELNIDLRKVWEICHRIKAVSVHNKDLKFLSELIFGSSHKFSHDHRVIRNLWLNLKDIFVDSVFSRRGVELEGEVVG